MKKNLHLQKNFEDKYNKDKKYRRVRDHCHFGGTYY